jgi:tripartite-type tricarboxylate transporter receptor subunit TctC
MSTIARRQLILASAAAATGSALSPAWAQVQSHPQRPKGKPVKLIVGFPPGQATDNVARLLVEKWQKNSGETFVVENMPGQGGSLALGNLAKAPNDGSVMMLAHMSALCTNPHLYKSVPADSLKDFEPVGLLGDLPFVLVCNPALPFQNVQELVAYAKANPDKLNNASSGNGTVSHLAMEEFKRKAGIKIVHIPYKGSAAGLTDVMSGTVSIALETAAAVRPLAQAGKLRALAAGTSTRLPGSLANVPTPSWPPNWWPQACNCAAATAPTRPALICAASSRAGAKWSSAAASPWNDGWMEPAGLHIIGTRRLI